MNELPSHRIDEIVTWLQRHVRPELMERVSRHDLESLVRDLLFGSRDMWQATLDGIVTKEETCSFVLAHVDTWVLHQVGQMSFDTPEALVTDQKAAELLDLIFDDVDAPSRAPRP